MSKPGFLAVCLVGMVIFAAACTAAEEPNAFTINKMLGRGVNIGGALDGPTATEGEWGVTLREEYFQIIKDAGFNSVRLAIRWNARAAKEPPYTIDPNFFKRIDWAINNCLSRNIPVVLTTHHYDELYSDPNGQKDRFVAIWKQIAERYKDYPNILIFDPLMEALGKLDADKWNSLLKETIVTVRRSNPNRTIVICPAGLLCIDNLHLLELPKDDRNIIVSIFYYLPNEFTVQGANWVEGSEKWLGTKWTGSEDEKQRIAKAFDIAADWAKKNKRPIYLNEFGTYEKADMESRVRWTKCVAETAAARGFSLSYWEFCSGFGLYDSQTKSWRKGLLDAIVPPKQ
ncbi:MAG: glycoside hydrolase family 5 protein [Sedimentisphaerales bacterium]|jgi:endoglucanase